MSAVFRDPKIDVVRAPFLEGLSRFCLLLALGNFSCIAPLYLILKYNQAASPLFAQYTTLLTIVGILLTALGVLCRYHSLGNVIAKICILILFLQPCFFLYQTKSLQNPTIMFFPLLCFLSTPVLGLRSTYYVAIASTLAIFALNAAIFPKPFELQHLSIAALIGIGIFFSAYISSVLWKSVLKREEKLSAALKELQAKSNQIEQWAQQLAGASSLINEGSLSLQLPNPPSHASFKQLTENIEGMQKKLGRYFGQLVVQDRLNSIGVLASGLAHELNTPLTSIRFLLEANKEHFPKSLMADIQTEVDRMASITRDFLTFASPHQDGETLDLNATVKIAIPLLERLHGGNATITLDLTPDPLPMRAVKTQVEQILLNLFKNSLDARSPKQPLRFTVTTRKLGEFQCLIKLQDNGCGIPRDILSKVFDPFYTTKDTGKGVGLGLYIVQEIIKSHHGVVTIESELGLGTAFTITFPLAVSAQQGRAA